MKEHPILFSGPMVKAILEGRKTQTRRIVKPYGLGELLDEWPKGSGIFCEREFGREECIIRQNVCPYGQPGDRLWVRETWAPRGVHPVTRPDGKFGAAVIEYRADGQRATWNHDPIQRIKDDWRPSIFMPRWASRITLEVTAVRVERLQDISPEDALAEGIDHYVPGVTAGQRGEVEADPIAEYRELWESINGPGSWAENPWVWALSFKRITP